MARPGDSRSAFSRHISTWFPSAEAQELHRRLAAAAECHRDSIDLVVSPDEILLLMQALEDQQIELPRLRRPSGFEVCARRAVYEFEHGEDAFAKRAARLVKSLGARKKTVGSRPEVILEEFHQLTRRAGPITLLDRAAIAAELPASKNPPKVPDVAFGHLSPLKALRALAERHHSKNEKSMLKALHEAKRAVRHQIETETDPFRRAHLNDLVESVSLPQNDEAR